MGTNVVERIPSRPPGKVSWPRKIAYGIGGAGEAIPYNLFYLYFLFYLTDVVGVQPAFAGIISTIAVFWDAITDPIFGNISDNTRSPLGRRRKWMMMGVVPLAVFTFLLFAPVHLQGGLQMTYYVVICLFLWTAYDFWVIPFFALNVEITSDYGERNTLRTMVMLIEYVLLIFCTSGPMWILDAVTKAGGKELTAWSYTGIVFGIFIFVAGIICLAGVKGQEKQIDEETHKKNKANVFKVFVGLFKLKAYRVTVLLTLVYGLGVSITGTSIVYVLTYVAEATAAQQGTFWVIYSVISIIMLPIVSHFCSKFGKKETIIALLIIGIINGVVFFLTGMNSFVAAIIWSVFGATVCSSYLTFYVAVTYDICEIEEYKSGAKREAQVISIASFAQKASAALSMAIISAILEFIHYDASLEVQTASTNTGLLALCTLIPAATFLIAGIVMMLYPVRKKDFIALQGAIEKRKTGEDYDEEAFKHIL
jgi:GPH family glycoside/pentoside/hexuronide:cation symporter